MSEKPHAGCGEAMMIDKVPLQVSADKDRKRFSGPGGRSYQTSKLGKQNCVLVPCF